MMDGTFFLGKETHLQLCDHFDLNSCEVKLISGHMLDGLYFW